MRGKLHTRDLKPQRASQSNGVKPKSKQLGHNCYKNSEKENEIMMISDDTSVSIKTAPLKTQEKDAIDIITPYLKQNEYNEDFDKLDDMEASSSSAEDEIGV